MLHLRSNSSDAMWPASLTGTLSGMKLRSCNVINVWIDPSKHSIKHALSLSRRNTHSKQLLHSSPPTPPRFPSHPPHPPQPMSSDSDAGRLHLPVPPESRENSRFPSIAQLPSSPPGNKSAASLLWEHDYSAIRRSATNVTWMSMWRVPTLGVLGVYQQLISKTQSPRSLNPDGSMVAGWRDQGGGAFNSDP
ncbi:unnamed protein product [Pleuronectes platessa]|uniref:Uncharacterized protein n=1 Tax=Pleuronectes platessa TaxID=8262 RepID=A0A9N7USN2_PLEPL|nr:unnamed protein product [Pleuronectes platessa]